MVTYREFMLAAHEFYVREAMNEAKGIVKDAARIAGVNRTHFHRWTSKISLPSRSKRGRRVTWRMT